MRSMKEIMRSYAVFDGQGRHVNGSDKESNHHYGDAYEAIINSAFRQRLMRALYGPSYAHPHMVAKYAARGSVKLMMEVGVADGSSLLAWRDIFPNATVVGLDIHPSDKAHGERVEFHLGDQRVQEDCERAAAGRQFDLIVDDATHLLEDTLRTLYWLWPSVRPGGLYVVEEWPSVDPTRITSLWPQAELVGTCGPSGQDEPLVVFRKPT